MTKKILTIGFELASPAVETRSFSSKASLLDWDIILIRPDFVDLIEHHKTFQGKPSLIERSSFSVKEACEHWRREIKQAVDNGKTVIAFLCSMTEVYVDTGKREYSGTGHNQKTTTIVDLYSNYQALPVSIVFVTANGASMKLTALGTDLLGPYWAEFGSLSEYKVQLPLDTKSACITTRSGDMPVGAVFRSKSSLGALVLLPEVDFFRDDFFEDGANDDETAGDDGGKGYTDKDASDEDAVSWAPAANVFAAKMIGAIVALDKALHSSADVTPEPAWATEARHALPKEAELRALLLEAERQVEDAQQHKESIAEQLRSAGQLRALLFEKGKPLEAAIIEALGVLGFRAANYTDGDSEFDVVFESSEGRLLGEAEGKDNKAINIEKLRQLAMNIHEDLLRPSVEHPAKPVLFGNGNRLTPPEERDLQFTTKCIAAAEGSNTALVATSELYNAIQYLLREDDIEFARACRAAILNGSGLIRLPKPPDLPPTASNSIESEMP